MCGSIRNDIGIDESIALDSFADMHGNGRREHRPGRDHRMELAVLATRVDTTWETGVFGKGDRKCPSPKSTSPRANMMRLA